MIFRSAWRPALRYAVWVNSQALRAFAYLRAGISTGFQCFDEPGRARYLRRGFLKGEAEVFASFTEPPGDRGGHRRGSSRRRTLPCRLRDVRAFRVLLAGFHFFPSWRLVDNDERDRHGKQDHRRDQEHDRRPYPVVLGGGQR